MTVWIKLGGSGPQRTLPAISVEVGSGSNSEVWPPARHVRCTPNSRHCPATRSGPFSANKRHCAPLFRAALDKCCSLT